MFSSVLFLSKIFGFFKGLVELVIKNPKSLFLIIVSIVVFVIYLRVSSKMSNLQTQVENERIEKDKANAALTVAVDVNKKNEQVITDLTVANKQNQESSSKLSAQLKDSSKTIKALKDKIDAAPQSDDGPVAKILADTVEEIQSKKGTK